MHHYLNPELPLCNRIEHFSGHRHEKYQTKTNCGLFVDAQSEMLKTVCCLTAKFPFQKSPQRQDFVRLRLGKLVVAYTKRCYYFTFII